MKKLFTFLSVLPLASIAFGQAITINATDIPVPGTFNCQDLSANPLANPTTGSNQVWNYGTYSGTAFTNVYTPETLSAFTSLGVDVYTASSKTLTPGFVYYTYTELDFNSSSVNDAGVSLAAQGYDLSPFTGSTADSIIFPAQNVIASAPRTIMKFPFTANSSWESTSRRAVDFQLSVASASLSHTPGQQVFYSYRKDTIVGWGKLTVHAASGPSIQYDVLMDKIVAYNTDSFYLGGAPAPATLMTAFGISQNQKTDSVCRYNFYRKGYYNYLYSIYYGSDASFTTPQKQYMHTDNLTPVGINDLNGGSITTVLFPNPSSGKELNILVSGTQAAAGKYVITDLTGKTVQAGTVSGTTNLHIDLDNAMNNGNYIITVLTANNTPMFTEYFAVLK